MSASTTTAATCTTTIITLEHCALNNAQVQHFILRSNKAFLVGGHH
jgi:hypothetical protein